MPRRSLQLGRLHFHHTLLDWVGLWPLAILAHRRRILFANEAAVHLLGARRRRDLIGRDVERVYRPESYSPFSKPAVSRLQLRRFDGERVPCDVLAVHVPMLERGLTLMFLSPASGEADYRERGGFVDRSQKNYLTNTKVRDSVFLVKNSMTLEPEEEPHIMLGTRLIDLNPPEPERAKKPPQKVYLHHCAMCQGDWVGYDADPRRCNYCYSPRWRSGKTVWDQRHEYDEMVGDHPYSREEILDLMRGRGDGMTSFEVVQGLQLPHSRYDAVRRTLVRMLRDKQLVRIKRGRYAAARNGA